LRSDRRHDCSIVVIGKVNPVQGFSSDRSNPYIQNYNFEIQHELAKNLTLEVRYIGSKGTRLYGGISINDVNIY
jgi:hypothetical protein